jgi:hypothetical protein
MIPAQNRTPTMEDRMKCLTLALKQDLRVLHPFHHLKTPVRAGVS